MTKRQPRRRRHLLRPRRRAVETQAAQDVGKEVEGSSVVANSSARTDATTSPSGADGAADSTSPILEEDAEHTNNMDGHGSGHDAEHHEDDHNEEHDDESDQHDFTLQLSQTQSTLSGYDVESGTSPICWLTPGTTSPSLGASSPSLYPNVWHTNFAPDFYSAKTEMMRSCFQGFELKLLDRPKRVDTGDGSEQERDFWAAVEAVGHAHDHPGHDHEGDGVSSDSEDGHGHGHGHGHAEGHTSGDSGDDSSDNTEEREEREERYYTGQTYSYTIKGTLPLNSVRSALGPSAQIYGEARNSQNAFIFEPKISVELIFCRVRTMGGGLCSPFIYQNDVHGDSHVSKNDGLVHEHRAAVPVGVVEEEDNHEQDNHHHEEEEEEEGGNHPSDDGTLQHSEDANLHTSIGKDSHDENFSETTDHGGHDSHDGNDHDIADHSFLQSQVIMFNVLPNQTTIDIDLDIPYKMDKAESVFVIATVRTLFSAPPIGRAAESSAAATATATAEHNTIYKFDASNIISQRVLTFEDSPQINTISQGTLIFSYVLIGLVGLGIATLLALVVKHRKHKVFRLSQATFLMVALSGALVASAASFLFQPKNTLYCNLWGPLVITPAHLMVTTITFRLWRIRCLMSPLMGWAETHTKILSTRGARRAAKRWLPQMGGSRPQSQSTSTSSLENSSVSENQDKRRWKQLLSRGKMTRATSLRRRVTARHLWLYIFLATLPQVVVQVNHLIVDPYEQDIDWNDDRTVGRKHCHSSKAGGIFNWLGYTMFFLAVFGLLLVSFRTRNLPSLFNEASGMFSTIAVFVCITAVGVALILATNLPESNPDVRYLVTVVIILSLTGQLSYKIIWPKLQVVWSGEVIVVSQLFQESASKRRNDLSEKLKSHTGNDSKPPRTERNVNTENAENGQAERPDVSLPDASTLTIEEGPARHLTPAPATNEEGKKEDNASNQNGTRKRGAIATLSSSVRHMILPSTGREVGNKEDLECIHENEDRKVVGFASSVVTEETHESIHISEDGAPPRELTMMLLQLSQLVSKSNNRMLSGIQMSRDEWEELCGALIKMGHVFESDIKFDWLDAEGRETAAITSTSRKEK